MKQQKKIAILQSNYIPWKGYFDIINMVDEFIILDEVQYTKNDWRNRNLIKTQHGVHWITIPVKMSFLQKISETEIANNRWFIKHWNTLRLEYGKAKYFNQYKDVFEKFYLETAPSLTLLSDINREMIKIICNILGIQTKITLDRDYQIIDGQTERLLDLCQKAGATTYLSGPAAKNYFDMDLFQRNGITVEWMDYSGYKEYDQLYPPFEHGVSILDLIFSEGENAKKYMKSFSND